MALRIANQVLRQSELFSLLRVSMPRLLDNSSLSLILPTRDYLLHHRTDFVN